MDLDKDYIIAQEILEYASEAYLIDLMNNKYKSVHIGKLYRRISEDIVYAANLDGVYFDGCYDRQRVIFHIYLGVEEKCNEIRLREILS